MSKEIMTAIAILESTQQEVTEEMQVNEVEQIAQTSADEVYEAPRLVQWNESSALLLLNTYKEYINEFSSPFTKKKIVWQKIAQILNENHGYGVTALQCENKFKSMSVAYKKAIENNKRSVASHRSHVLFQELDDLFRHNPIVHHIGVASSSSGFQFNNDPNESHAEQLLNIVKSKGKRKRMDLPEWVRGVLEGVERRHKERMEKYDKLIAVLEKIANK